MATNKPAAVRVNQKLNVSKWLAKHANKLSQSKAVQRHLQIELTKNYEKVYADAYKYLVRQIQAHLDKGFNISKDGSVSIFLENPATGAFHEIKKKWDPLSERYRRRKAAAFRGESMAYGEAERASAKAKRGKKKARPNLLKLPVDTSKLFWVFRRNLARGASTTPGFSEAAAWVKLEKEKAKKGGVLVTYGNRATIRYNVGLRFGKLAAPFDDMVRKPFVTGMKEKSRVWDDRAGPSNKAGREIHVLAYVEAKRPFIVDLSATVGKMVRQRLRIEN